LNWDTYFFKIAELVASKSKDPSTKVGCVIVGPDRSVRITGYNGPPPGVLDLPERFERPAKYLFTSHAECSAISLAARNGVALNGCGLYVTHFPCNECAKMIIASGIRWLKYGSGKTNMAPELFQISKTMLGEAGIDIQLIAEEC
jgi:dCMP deaminase